MSEFGITIDENTSEFSRSFAKFSLNIGDNVYDAVSKITKALNHFNELELGGERLTVRQKNIKSFLQDLLSDLNSDIADYADTLKSGGEA